MFWDTLRLLFMVLWCLNPGGRSTKTDSLSRLDLTLTRIQTTLYLFVVDYFIRDNSWRCINTRERNKDLEKLHLSMNWIELNCRVVDCAVESRSFILLAKRRAAATCNPQRAHVSPWFAIRHARHPPLPLSRVSNLTNSTIELHFQKYINTYKEHSDILNKLTKEIKLCRKILRDI